MIKLIQSVINYFWYKRVHATLEEKIVARADELHEPEMYRKLNEKILKMYANGDDIFKIALEVDLSCASVRARLCRIGVDWTDIT